MRYFGSFEVLERIGLIGYKLKLPDTMKIHSVFHISLLRNVKEHPDNKVSLLLYSMMTKDRYFNHQLY